MHALFSALFWVFMVLSSIALFPVAVGVWLLTLPFDARLRALHLFTSFWASLYTWLNPAWRVEIEGRAKADPDEAYVMVANHLSLVDILVLFRLFLHYKWVSKIENFRVPCIGWTMSLNRYIKLRRGNRRSVITMMGACLEHLERGSSIMMFPEGTRSPSGRIRRFKTGAFEIALKARRPILPIVIQGTHEALPKRGLVLRGRHAIRVTLLDPIPYQDFAGADPEGLAEGVRGRIAAVLGEQEPAPAALAEGG